MSLVGARLAVDRLAGAGVSFNRYYGMVQDDRGIWTAPDGGPRGGATNLASHGEDVSGRVDRM